MGLCIVLCECIQLKAAWLELNFIFSVCFSIQKELYMGLVFSSLVVRSGSRSHRSTWKEAGPKQELSVHFVAIADQRLSTDINAADQRLSTDKQANFAMMNK
ncbi:hypothetical protein SDJN02_19705, partial [Cucurbita argyrosperma subsp. argyrosperma]